MAGDTRAGWAEGAQEQPWALASPGAPACNVAPKGGGRTPHAWLPSIRSPSTLINPLRAPAPFAGGDTEVQRRRGCSCRVTPAGRGARRTEGDMLFPRGEGRGAGAEAAAARRGLGTPRRVPASQVAPPLSSARRRGSQRLPGSPDPVVRKATRSALVLAAGALPTRFQDRSRRRRVHQRPPPPPRPARPQPQGAGTRGTRFRRHWRLGARGEPTAEDRRQRGGGNPWACLKVLKWMGDSLGNRVRALLPATARAIRSRGPRSLRCAPRPPGALGRRRARGDPGAFPRRRRRRCSGGTGGFPARAATLRRGLPLPSPDALLNSEYRTSRFRGSFLVPRPLLSRAMYYYSFIDLVVDGCPGLYLFQVGSVRSPSLCTRPRKSSCHPSPNAGPLRRSRPPQPLLTQNSCKNLQQDPLMGVLSVECVASCIIFLRIQNCFLGEITSWFL